MNGLFLGAFGHADDIRSSAAIIEDSAEQVAIVDKFTSSKSLKLAPEKMHSPHQPTRTTFTLPISVLELERHVYL